MMVVSMGTDTDRTESCHDSSCPAYYALILFAILTAVNQLHRYLLIAAIEPMSNELKFGEKECIVHNDTAAEALGLLNKTSNEFCAANESIRCTNQTTFHDEILCEWHYTGMGIEYEILAGPVFIIVLGVLGVPVTVLAEIGRINRRNVVAICAICWSITIICTGFAQTLAEVTVWRFLLGFFQAPFNPFTYSMLASFFAPSQRGMAIGIAASGAYAGYGLSYAFIALVDLIGWRWTYISSGIAGALLGILTIFTVRNPRPQADDLKSTRLGSLREMWHLLRPQPWAVLLPVFLAFSCKMGYQYTLSYNLNNYFVEYFPKFETDVYLSWTLALTGFVSFTLGGILGDVVGKRYHAIGRLSVIVVLQVMQLPLYVFFILLGIPANIILGAIGMAVGDGWMGIGTSAMADIVSSNVRTVVFALFFCTMDVVGGCVIVAVTPITECIGFRAALLWLGTGMLVGGMLLVLVSIAVLARMNRKKGSWDTVASDREDRMDNRVPQETDPLISTDNTTST